MQEMGESLNDPKAPFSKKFASVGKYLQGIANVGISPISFLFGAAEETPVLGTAARTYLLPFQAIGELLSKGGVEGLKQLENKGIIAEETRKNLEPFVEETGQFVGMVGGFASIHGLARAIRLKISSVSIPKELKGGIEIGEIEPKIKTIIKRFNEQKLTLQDFVADRELPKSISRYGNVPVRMGDPNSFVRIDPKIQKVIFEGAYYDKKLKVIFINPHPITGLLTQSGIETTIKHEAQHVKDIISTGITSEKSAIAAEKIKIK